MKPKAEMLRKLSYSLLVKEKDVTFSIHLENKFLDKIRERLQRRTQRGTPLCLYIIRSCSPRLCLYYCAAVGVGQPWGYPLGGTCHPSGLGELPPWSPTAPSAPAVVSGKMATQPS